MTTRNERKKINVLVILEKIRNICSRAIADVIDVYNEAHINFTIKSKYPIFQDEYLEEIIMTILAPKSLLQNKTP